MFALVDIGVNLTHRRFDADREAVVERAAAAGVSRLVLTGTNISHSQKAADYARGRPGLYSTAGVHPHHATELTETTLQTLGQLAQQPQVVAIGETGLDFNRDFSPRPVQEQAFEAQVALACELQMPLFVHEREAHERLLAILDGFKTLPPLVVHCFTGPAHELEAYLSRGFYIGLTGWLCDERRGRHLLEIIRTIPLDRLMLETDAPFITPRDLQPKPEGGRNEPAFLPHILKAVAAAYALPEQVLAQASSATAQAFFGLV